MEQIWFCEKHPELEMGHDCCDGAGILEEARIPMLVLQRRLLTQQIRELKKFYGYNILELKRLLDSFSVQDEGEEIKKG